MTRAIDRLIVSGAIDESRDTPIGWVLSKLDCEAELAARRKSLELERGGASFLVRRRPLSAPSAPAEPEHVRRGEAASSRSSPSFRPRPRRARLPAARARSRCRRRRSTASGGSPTRRWRSSSAAPTATTPSASPACASGARAGAGGGGPGGDRDRRRRPPAARARRPRATRGFPTLESVRDVVSGGHRGGARADRRVRGRLLRLAARAPRRGPRRRASRAPVRVRARRRPPPRPPRRAPPRDGPARSSSTTRRTSSASAAPEEVVEADYRLQRLVYALACFRAGAEEVEVVYAFLERPGRRRLERRSRAPTLAALEAELSAAIARIDAGEFVPTPGEFTCSGCPALDVVCAGPRLRGGRPPVAEAVEVAAASS